MINITIEWTYKTSKGTETFLKSEPMPANKALLIAEDIEKTGRVKKLSLIDNYDSSWTLKELKKYIKEVDAEPHHIKVYFDGGFDVASHASGLGCVIYYEQNGKSYRMRKNRFARDLHSNNEAEYAALHLAVLELEGLFVHHLPVKFIGDSQVVINQMRGEWPAYEKDLAWWADQIDEKLNELNIEAEYVAVPRSENAEADRLATQALQGIDIEAKIEL